MVLPQIGTLWWFILIVILAWAATGVIEWVKGFFRKDDGTNKLPSWGWRLALLIVSAGIGTALAGAYGAAQIALLWGALLHGSLVLAAGQLGYPVLVQLPEAVVKALRRMIDQAGGGVNG